MLGCLARKCLPNGLQTISETYTVYRRTSKSRSAYCPARGEQVSLVKLDSGTLMTLILLHGIGRDNEIKACARRVRRNPDHRRHPDGANHLGRGFAERNAEESGSSASASNANQS